MRHLVKRQIFDLRLPSHREAFGAQQRLSRFFWDEAAPALEKLFDRLAPADRIVRLDRLEIDLGNLTEGELTSEATLQRLIAAVEEAIGRALRDTGLAPQDTDPRGSVFDQWLHFLATGILPWYAASDLPDGWRGSVLEWLGLQAPAAERLRKLLAGSNSTVDRLVLQHEAPFLTAVAALLTGFPQQALHDIELEIKDLLTLAPREKRPPASGNLDSRKVQSWLWKWAFHRIAVLGRKEPGDVLAADFLIHALNAPDLIWMANKVLRPKARSRYPQLSRLFTQDKALTDFISREKKSAEPAGLQHGKGTENLHDPGVSSQAHATLDGDLSSSDSRTTPKEPATLVPGSDKLSRTQPAPPGDAGEHSSESSGLPEKEDSWLIQNAGVVLLNGYLPSFFANLDLLGPDKKFRNRATRAKAAALIHYLAVAEAEAPEYHLLLPKILCGIPAGQVLDRFQALSTEDMEEAEALLSAAVDHWSVLGKTSPAGLREAFLSRSGQLTRREQGWLLRVERNTLDILLQQAPFAYSVIKLPWMKDMLWVEW